MNKAFEKILERLEETDFNDIQMTVREVLLKYGFPYESVIQDEVWDALDELSTNKFAKRIVQEVAQEYNDGWIPCSERLPEEELEKAMRERGENAVFPVLATINKVHLISGEKYKIVSRAFYGQYNDKNFYNSCCDRLDVIAWQQLPEPYQQKGE